MLFLNLVTAYRASGKDTLFDEVNAGSLKCTNVLLPHQKPRWLVYHHPQTNSKAFPLIAPGVHHLRTPAAGEGKLMTHQVALLPEDHKDIWPLLCAWRLLFWYQQWSLALHHFRWGLALCWKRYVYGKKNSAFESYKKELRVPISRKWPRRWERWTRGPL